MKKTLFTIASLTFLLLSSCGKSEEEKIELATAKILVNYNKIISKVKKYESESEAWGLGSSYQGSDAYMLGSIKENYKKKQFNEFKIDSLQKDFLEKFGEDNYNLLLIKIDDNLNNKR